MNEKLKGKQSRLTLPNLLSGFRFIAAPFLLALAWYNHDIAFLWLLAITFLSDVLDGLAARLMGQVTQFGAQLDTWGDMLTYLTIAICSWWLWPEIVRREGIYVTMVIASYMLPAIAGIIKFGSFTSYHTWTVKLAAVSMGLTLYILFLGGPSWPFHIAAFVCVIAAIEEIFITLILTEIRTDIRFITDVLPRKHG